MFKKYPLLLSILATAMLLVSACSPTISGPTTGSGSNLTPLQVLEKSADAMRQLKSAHIELQATSAVLGTGTTAGTPTASTPAPSLLNINMRGSGDEALPDQEQLKLTIGSSTNIAEIVLGDKVYLQNAQGQWYVLDKNTLANQVGNPFSGVNLDQNSILALVQHAKITDNGTQSLNGQSLRHITADLDKEALRGLLNENPQLVSNLGKQNIDTVLNNTKTFQSSIDVWIDETQFYVHRTELKINLDVDTSSLSGTPTTAGIIPSGVTTKLDNIVDLSNFNAPVTITPPANAIPTDNPGTVFGIEA